MSFTKWLVALSVAAACVSACGHEPARNCWDSRYPFEAFPAPTSAEPYLFACRAKGPNPGIGIRADGTVVLLEVGVDASGVATEWRARTTDGGAPRVVPPAELAARGEQVAKLPAMPWPWDRTLQDELDCFGRTASGSNTVVPLSAGTRPPSAGAKSVLDWMNGLKR